MLKKKYIKFNSLLYINFVLIVKKFNKEFRIYIDYRIFNAFIIFNRNASLLIKEIFIKLYTIKIYNKFDIIITFNEIRVKKNYEEKIAFLIKYDLYKYIIMSFELCNASIIFQTFINNVFRKYLNVFYIIYLNNILIYNNIKEKHIQHMNKMLKKLKQINLYFDINKCEFYIIKIKYLRLIIIIKDV